MKQKTQRMSIYFPPDLLELVRQSAVVHHRSFNQEVLHILSSELNYRKSIALEAQRTKEVEIAILTELVHAKPEEFEALRKKYHVDRLSQEQLREYLDMLSKLP